MKTTFKSADLKMSILSNVRRCWLAMPPVVGFLEMFAGVPYNREKNESLILREGLKKEAKVGNCSQPDLCCF